MRRSLTPPYRGAFWTGVPPNAPGSPLRSKQPTSLGNVLGDLVAQSLDAGEPAFVPQPVVELDPHDRAVQVAFRIEEVHFEHELLPSGSGMRVPAEGRIEPEVRGPGEGRPEARRMEFESARRV